MMNVLKLLSEIIIDKRFARNLFAAENKEMFFENRDAKCTK